MENSLKNLRKENALEYRDTGLDCIKKNIYHEIRESILLKSLKMPIEIYIYTFAYTSTNICIFVQEWFFNNI